MSRALSPSNGGCDFPIDPQASALTQPIFWTPQVDPGAIIFAVGPPPEGSSITGEMLRLRAIIQHGRDLLRLELRGERYDILLVEPDAQGPLGIHIIFDDLMPDRKTTLERFWNAMAGKRVPHDPRLTPQRHQRARQMLRAIDARFVGSTYRDIAEVLFPNHEHDPAKWGDSPFRVMMSRLVRDGMAFVRGGYRTLLRRPRRHR